MLSLTVIAASQSSASDMPVSAVAVLGDRRVHHHVAGLEPDAPVEAFPLRVDAREDGGSRQQLEGAAHGETLVDAMAGPLAAERVEDGDAEPSAALDFDLVQVAGELRDKPRAARAPFGPPLRPHPTRAAPAPIANRAC